MYSDLLNGEHFFFFSAYDFIASTRKSASSTMRKSRFRVKRTIEIPSKSIDIYFLFSTRFEQPYFYRAKTFSKPHNNLPVISIIIISFEKTRCNFRKRSNSIFDTYLNFLNQLINVGYIKHRIKRRNNFFLNF